MHRMNVFERLIALFPTVDPSFRCCQTVSAASNLLFFPENYLPNKKNGLPLPSQFVKGKKVEVHCICLRE